MLKGHLDMILLAALAPGPAHGYAVIEEIRRRSAGAFDLPEGTIYPVLHRLEDSGPLARRWVPAAVGPALARRVGREVEDHLLEVVEGDPAADRQEAERRAVASFGEPRALAAQFAVVSLAAPARGGGLVAVL